VDDYLDYSLAEELERNKKWIDRAIDSGNISLGIELMDENYLMVLKGIADNRKLISGLEAGLKRIKSIRKWESLQKTVSLRKELDEERINLMIKMCALQRKGYTNLAGNN
jgi:hypothetical protein